MTNINVANPLLEPYPTGSYLIFDNPAGKDNFRNAMLLPEQRYRASGDHQQDLDVLVRDLRGAIAPVSPERLFLVDLREETHGYIDTDDGVGRAISWYADNDWSNVGLTRWWIEHEERDRLGLLSRQAEVRVFTIEADPGDNRQQERQLPLSYTDVPISWACHEKNVTYVIEKELGVPVTYVRIPSTDHCAPSPVALEDLEALASRVGPADWVHFHCHGGDGRTTTFLALWDMLQWQGTLPPLTEFSDRQCSLFDYCLDPAGGPAGCKVESAPWKIPLAEQRWVMLAEFLHGLKH